MYCPQCGQQQVSNEIRYCSRCGFPLTGVADLLVRGGVAPFPPSSTEQRGLSPRQKGIRQGAILMISTVLMVPVMAIFSVFILGRPEIFIPLTAMVLFLGGLLRIIYAAMMEDNTKAALPALSSGYNPPYRHGELNPGFSGAALPPAPGQPVPSWRPRVNTSELAPPPSVTENTTRLLDKESEPRGN
jgi:hypothetical protein